MSGPVKDNYIKVHVLTNISYYRHSPTFLTMITPAQKCSNRLKTVYVTIVCKETLVFDQWAEQKLSNNGITDQYLKLLRIAIDPH